MEKQYATRVKVEGGYSLSKSMKLSELVEALTSVLPADILYEIELSANGQVSHKPIGIFGLKINSMEEYGIQGDSSGSVQGSGIGDNVSGDEGRVRESSLEGVQGGASPKSQSKSKGKNNRRKQAKTEQRKIKPHLIAPPLVVGASE